MNHDQGRTILTRASGLAGTARMVLIGILIMPFFQSASAGAHTPSFSGNIQVLGLGSPVDLDLNLYQASECSNHVENNVQGVYVDAQPLRGHRVTISTDRALGHALRVAYSTLPCLDPGMRTADGWLHIFDVTWTNYSRSFIVPGNATHIAISNRSTFSSAIGVPWRFEARHV